MIKLLIGMTVIGGFGYAMLFTEIHIDEHDRAAEVIERNYAEAKALEAKAKANAMRAWRTIPDQD